MYLHTILIQFLFADQLPKLKYNLALTDTMCSSRVIIALVIIAL